jgi:hypothetical protein
MPCCRDIAFDDTRHVHIKRCQDLVEQLDEGDVETAMHQVLGRF